MKKLLPFAVAVLALPLCAQQKLRIIAIGAHPDDCDIRSAGTAIKFAKAGHAVKFLSVTNGDAGHQSEGGGMLAKRRYLETQESAKRSGIAEYEVLDNHDGELTPTVEVRKQIIRAIRKWNADIVLAPRPNDYHPDHRYTGVLVQDAAYMVVVPNVTPDTPPLRKNPIFLYYQDHFQKPAPFRPDVVVNIDDVWEQKVNTLDSHVSQFYEWLPWVDGILDSVPRDPVQRKEWMGKMRTLKHTPQIITAIDRRYGPGASSRIVHAESFELCEYGRQPSLEELSALFPK